MIPDPALISFRPTAAQACARGAYRGGVAGLGAGGTIAVVGLTLRVDSPSWLLGLIPFALLTLAGAVSGLTFGRGEGADVDEWGIHCVPAAPGRGAAWQHINDLHTERRGGRIRVSLRMDSGQVGQLRAPYDGRWLAGDRQFEHKLFLLCNMWATHRNFTLAKGFPPDVAYRG